MVEPKIFIVLRSLIFNIFFIFWTAIAVIIMAAFLLFPRAFMAFVVTVWAHTSSIALRVFVGLNFEIRGKENIEEGQVIFAAKHQSAWDTFAYFLIVKNPSYVLKKELLLIPFWGWCARRYGAIIVNRQGGGAALRKMVSDAKDRIKRKMPIIIFPEGTRSRPKERGVYHPGIAALYKTAGVPVIPVAVNSGVFWGRRSFRKLPGTIVIQFLPAIKPGLGRENFMKKLQSEIEGASDNLVAEAMAMLPK